MRPFRRTEKKEARESRTDNAVSERHSADGKGAPAPLSAIDRGREVRPLCLVVCPLLPFQPRPECPLRWQAFSACQGQHKRLPPLPSSQARARQPHHLRCAPPAHRLLQQTLVGRHPPRCGHSARCSPPMPSAFSRTRRAARPLSGSARSPAQLDGCERSRAEPVRSSSRLSRRARARRRRRSAARQRRPPPPRRLRVAPAPRSPRPLPRLRASRLPRSSPRGRVWRSAGRAPRTRPRCCRWARAIAPDRCASSM